MTDPAPAPATLGLASNSDEIAAIDEVEAEFGVTIDYADAPQWRTAGDVFGSLLTQLPAGQANDPEIWERFVRALSQTTDVDPEAITRDTPLADEVQAWRGLGGLSAALLLLLIGMALVVILGAVILAR
ncbi:hypothetical protein [Sphingomonas koreensis]